MTTAANGGGGADPRLQTAAAEHPDRLALHPADRPFIMLGSALAVAATAVIGGALVYGVIMRYAFNTSSQISTELPTYLFPWLIAGGVIAAMGRRGHLTVDYFTNKFAPERRRRVELYMWVLSALTHVFVLLLSFQLIVPMSRQLSPMLGWPVLWSFLAFMVTIAVLAVQCGIRAYATLTEAAEEGENRA
ncbi:TRAP transporter small permease [Nocardiopsis sp. NPDC006938]|uniref:TRAP transporter small permease n=1 Tax=Nocardiopsis sp. NPDC006938 TaxID=3364337 RepID=UPI0036B0FEC8